MQKCSNLNLVVPLRISYITTMTPKTASVLRLSSYDYVIFVGTLLCSTLIGIYYGCFGTKQATVKEYLLGGKKMKIVPIAVSVAVGYIYDFVHKLHLKNVATFQERC